MKILAVDLGKVKSVACDYRSQTGEHEFETVRTEPAIPADLFRRRCPDRVVIEVGPAAGWIADLAARMKIELQVANPSHQGWRRRGVKNKTDRVDAVKPAPLSSVNQLSQVKLPSIAIVAVAGRLLMGCWAMMRDDQDWNPRALEAA